MITRVLANLSYHELFREDLAVHQETAVCGTIIIYTLNIHQSINHYPNTGKGSTVGH